MLFRFAGKRDREFSTTWGNKFLLEGTVEGTKNAMVKIFGPHADLLYVKAKCVHIWETGDANVSSSPGESGYPPTRQRTVCTE